jgi:hypothetical protein
MKFPESRQLAPVRQRILGRKRQFNNIGPFDCFDHVSPFAATPTGCVGSWPDDRPSTPRRLEYVGTLIFGRVSPLWLSSENGPA